MGPHYGSGNTGKRQFLLLILGTTLKLMWKITACIVGLRLMRFFYKLEAEKNNKSLKMDEKEQNQSRFKFFILTSINEMLSALKTSPGLFLPLVQSNQTITLVCISQHQHNEP